jgi:hypothetical protein
VGSKLDLTNHWKSDWWPQFVRIVYKAMMDEATDWMSILVILLADFISSLFALLLRIFCILPTDHFTSTFFTIVSTQKINLLSHFRGIV